MELTWSTWNNLQESKMAAKYREYFFHSIDPNPIVMSLLLRKLSIVLQVIIYVVIWGKKGNAFYKWYREQTLKKAFHAE